METINSIENLIETLNETDPEDCIHVAKRINISIDEFREYASWDDEHYTRNCIERNDAYELILLCWAPGHVTPIHDHDGQHCWVYQVEGELVEQRFEKLTNGELKETQSAASTPGDISYMHDKMGFHSLHNVSDKPAISLHLYMNPIESCNVFDDEKQTFERIEMCYNTVEGKEIRVGA